MSTNSSETEAAMPSTFDSQSNDEPGADQPDADQPDADERRSGARVEHADDDANDGDSVDRVETLIRILYTLLFFLIARVIEAAVGVIVFFQLVFSLITNRTPNPAVNAFARRVIEYGYQIGHYVTHNRDQPPFPFDELPADEPHSDRD